MCKVPAGAAFLEGVSLSRGASDLLGGISLSRAVSGLNAIDSAGDDAIVGESDWMDIMATLERDGDPFTTSVPEPEDSFASSVASTMLFDPDTILDEICADRPIAA